ncbi:C-CAP/cofactor C-like domain-containing protein [Caenorhabditis elegans]|uniref:C-CAP/cofactor C-like domain-containing protein n=2 Tax=Caenorhabditis elegans TaxID=6239 RepID=O02096_CAEEL|nr:C-CAP/cofactor C-like domain-containing protein [Caenorhabditis elegans]CCD65141.1 C-CAP/cofactor C-like domain-containing protein [Caenorhabditis elegans]|eukprot:NP_491324.1 Adenylyl cyclase-associated protein [Caenorhabditis elegans]
MDPSVVSRLENVANRTENILLKYDSNKKETPVDATPQIINLYDDAICENLVSFYDLSAKIGGDLNRLGCMTRSLFFTHRYFLWIACGRKKADNDEFATLVNDLSKEIVAFSDFKEKNRKSEFYNHICGLEAAVGGFGWVAEPKTPAPFIKDAIDTSVFYLNRILMEHKGKNDFHSEWAKSIKELMLSLHEYVRQHHTTGLVWNSDPGATPMCNRKSGGAPTPPPPPPPPISLIAPSKPSGVGALLESLNTGLSATSRLKKVTPEMQTHKNPVLREVNGQMNRKTEERKVSENKKPEKIHESSIFWDGKIWKVDHQVGNKNAVVEVTDKKESIYIYKCNDSIIKIKGKANAITLDGCRKTSVVFDGLVAQCEIINCQSIQIQTLGELPTVSIQKTDGCHIYLSRDALNAQIVASKSSEMNISAMLEDGDDEYTEMALPEQFMTKIVGKKLVTVASEIV